MAARTHRLCAATLAAACLASAAAAQCNPTVKLAHLFAADYENFNGFGQALVWNANGIFIGAPGADDLAGAVYVFEGSLSAPTQTKVTASDLLAWGSFGYSVAASGERMVVGAIDAEDLGWLSGSAYVFEKEGSGWVETAKLLASDGEEYHRFGTAVALAGDTLFVAATGDDDQAGAVYVFELQGPGWVETAKLTASDDTAYFGKCLSLQGDRLLVGARGDASRPGGVYVFENSAGQWIETAKITSASSSPDDSFGAAVAQAGDTVVVGARADDEAGLNAGAAYVFELQGSQWMEEAKLLAPAGDDFDFFGTSVAVRRTCAGRSAGHGRRRGQ